MFWMNNKTYYLSMDANNPTDNSSQTENNVHTAIKNFNIETSQNTFKFYFPPRNKLYYKNLLTLVKRPSVWFDHIMMSLIWCFDNFGWGKYPITESFKEEEKFIILFHLDSHRFLAISSSWKYDLITVVIQLAFVYYDLIFFTYKIILIKTDNTK